MIAIQRNPLSGSGRGRSELLRLVRILRSRDYGVRMFSSRERLDEWVRRPEVAENLRCIVASGGDGTLADVLNRHPSATLLPFPMGTENLMAGYLSIRKCGQQVADIIEQNRVVEFDTGLVNEHRFLIMVSLGLDAEVVRSLHQHRTGNIHHLSYLLPTARAFWRYRSQPVLVSVVDDDVCESDTLSGGHVIVSNVAAYGFGLQFTPDANPHDGVLDVCVYQGLSRFANVLYGLSLKLGQRWCDGRVRRIRGRRIRIRLTDSVGGSTSDDAGICSPTSGSVPVQADGDPCGTLANTNDSSADLIIQVDPRSLRLLVPDSYRLPAA